MVISCKLRNLDHAMKVLYNWYHPFQVGCPEIQILT